MDKNVVYIADSSMIHSSPESSIYCIMSVNGSDESINHLASSFNEIFKGVILSKDSFYDWYQINENRLMLLDFISNIVFKNSNCIFSSYVSDHDFSEFVLYFKSLYNLENHNQTEIIKYIDTLYQEFDKNLLLSINNDFDENRLVEINQCFFSLFDSLLPKELKNIIMSSITPFESQLKFISKMRNTFYKDLSMIDYLQCSSFLADLINEYSIDSIYATEHSKTFVSTIVAARCRMPVKFFNIKFNHQTISESENNHRTLLLNNLMVICDYGWNCLHNSESVETLSEHDRYLIIYLWLLFQSNYSNWMIASVDFAKIRKLLEDSNKPLMD